MLSLLTGIDSLPHEVFVRKLNVVLEWILLEQVTVLHLFASFQVTKLLAYRSCQIEIVPIKSILSLKMQPLNYVLSMPVNIVTAEQVREEETEPSQHEIVEESMEHVVLPAEVVVLNLTYLGFPELETNQPHSNCCQDGERSVHLPGPVLVCVFVHSNRSESVQVMF